MTDYVEKKRDNSSYWLQNAAAEQENKFNNASQRQLIQICLKAVQLVKWNP